jgi:hypothetical protein
MMSKGGIAVLVFHCVGVTRVRAWRDIRAWVMTFLVWKYRCEC